MDWLTSFGPSRYPYPTGNSLLDLRTSYLSLLTRPVEILVQLLGIFNPTTERPSQSLGHARIVADRLQVGRCQFRVELPQLLVGAAIRHRLYQVVNQQPRTFDHELP